MKRIVEQMRKLGTVDCCLQVRASNASAISFYKDLKFEVVKTMPKFYDDGADAYLMKRTFRAFPLPKNQLTWSNQPPILYPNQMSKTHHWTQTYGSTADISRKVSEMKAQF